MLLWRSELLSNGLSRNGRRHGTAMAVRPFSVTKKGLAMTHEPFRETSYKQSSFCQISHSLKWKVTAEAITQQSPTNLRHVFRTLWSTLQPRRARCVSSHLLIQERHQMPRAASLQSGKDYRLWNVRQSEGRVEPLRKENGEPLPAFVCTYL